MRNVEEYIFFVYAFTFVLVFDNSSISFHKTVNYWNILPTEIWFSFKRIYTPEQH